MRESERARESESQRERGSESVSVHETNECAYVLVYILNEKVHNMSVAS